MCAPVAESSWRKRKVLHGGVTARRVREKSYTRETVQQGNSFVGEKHRPSNDAPITKTHEVWTSQDLKLTTKEHCFGLRRDITLKI
jgi:hypothetical protein